MQLFQGEADAKFTAFISSGHTTMRRDKDMYDKDAENFDQARRISILFEDRSRTTGLVAAAAIKNGGTTPACNGQRKGSAVSEGGPR